MPIYVKNEIFEQFRELRNEKFRNLCNLRSTEVYGTTMDWLCGQDVSYNVCIFSVREYLMP